MPYENVYADRFFGIAGGLPIAGKDNGLLQGPLGDYRAMQKPLARNFSSLQTQLVGHVSNYKFNIQFLYFFSQGLRYIYSYAILGNCLALLCFNCLPITINLCAFFTHLSYKLLSIWLTYS